MPVWLTLVAVIAAMTVNVLPAFAQTVTTYRCADGSEVPVAFFQGDKRAHVQLDGKSLSLPKRISVTGSRYSKGGVSISIKGATATVRRGRKSTQCAAE
jgi:membrane-bound inhibitor of C-type lysozyme